MDIYNLFKKEFGIELDDAITQSKKFEAIDVVNFAQKYRKQSNSRIGSGITSEKLEQIDKNVDEAFKELKDSFSEKPKKQ